MIRKISKSGAPARESSLNKDAAIQGEAFPVVAIGASADGLEAYKEFFQALPSGTGSGVRIKPDCVYVIPPNAFMSISDGTFTLTPRNKGPGSIWQ